MTSEEDRMLLLEFSSRHGSALRLVLAHKDDIARWLDEGWSVRAIHRLLKTKGIDVPNYHSFIRAIKKVFHGAAVQGKDVVLRQDHEPKKQKQQNINRPRPHEIQRQQPQQFVTMAGMDHIGLDKKDK